MIQEIFLLMKANYGHKWTSNLSSPEEIKIAARLWLFHFHTYSRDNLHTALSHCFLRYDWPPSVKEFRTELRLAQRLEETQTLLQLPPPTNEQWPSKQAQKHLEQLKQLVGLS